MPNLLPYLTTALRAALVALATYLFTHGFLDEGQRSTFVDAVLPFALLVLSLGWGFFQKAKTSQHLAEAKGLLPSDPSTPQVPL